MLLLKYGRLITDDDGWLEIENIYHHHIKKVDLLAVL